MNQKNQIRTQKAINTRKQHHEIQQTFQERGILKIKQTTIH